MVGLPIVNGKIGNESALKTGSGLMRPDWSRRFIRGASRGCKVRFRQGEIIDPAADVKRGNSRSRCGSAEEQRFGETRIEVESANGEETRDLGQPGNWSRRRSQSGGFRGNPENQPRRTGWRVIRGDSDSCQPVPEDEYLGATRILIVGDTGGARRRGNLVNFATGTAEGCENRGDSTIDHR